MPYQKNGAVQMSSLLQSVLICGFHPKEGILEEMGSMRGLFLHTSEFGNDSGK